MRGREIKLEKRQLCQVSVSSYVTGKEGLRDLRGRMKDKNGGTMRGSSQPGLRSLHGQLQGAARGSLVSQPAGRIIFAIRHSSDPQSKIEIVFLDSPI